MKGEWKKSSRSLRTDWEQCVEVSLGDEVRVRDSKQVGGPVLQVSAAGWSSFVAGLKG
jgi:hypothetical protein